MKAKRIISCILMLLMLVSLMPAGFAATSEGDYYYNPGYNNSQQSATGVPGNSFVVQGDTPQQPSAGDSGSSSVHTHNWQLLDTIEEATCTSYGMATQVCYDCGATQTVYTNMLPHTWGEWAILTEATDHSAGERQRTCEVCGKTEKEKYYPDGTVLPGSSGEEVLELQDLLNENGIPAPRDGEYGDATREAVREAQRRNGYTVDGVAWPQTVNCLRHKFGEWEVLREPTLTKPGLQHRICEKCGYDEEEEFIDGLGPGARGDAVKRLQEMLTKLGYYDGRIDGDYGWYVQKAVEQWQREHGLPVTGIADAGTLEMIAAEANGNGRDGGTTVERDPYVPDRQDDEKIPDDENNPGGEPDENSDKEPDDEPGEESHSAVSPVSKEPDAEPKLVLEALSSPKNGEGYQENELIHMKATIYGERYSNTKISIYGVDGITGDFEHCDFGHEFSIFDYRVGYQDIKYNETLKFRAYCTYHKEQGDSGYELESNIVEIPLGGKVTVSIEITSTSKDENGYEPGETIKWRVTVRNGTYHVIYSVHVEDNLYTVTNDPAPEFVEFIGAGSSAYKDFEHVVEETDSEVIGSQGYASWTSELSGGGLTYSDVVISKKIAKQPDPVPGPTPHTDGDPVHIPDPNPVNDPDHKDESDYIPEPDPDPLPDPDPAPQREIESGIKVTKTVISTPGGGRSYYTKDEVIDYLIEVENTGNTLIIEAVVYDSINDGPSVEIASIDNFYPASTRQYYYNYTVTEADVSSGFATVKNSAFAAGTDEYNNGVYGDDFVESRVGPDDSESKRPYLTKEVVNKPNNGSFFVENEQIDYEIVVHNPSDLDIVYASISDGFNGGPLIGIAHSIVPAHSDSIPFPYCHIVTAEEAAAGKVTNLAIADCDLSDYSFIQIGDEVEAITGVEEEATPSAVFSDCCVRTLTGRGEGIAEYTLSYCHVHGPIAEQVRALLTTAGENPDESVWKQAAELWRAAIDEEYEELNVPDDYKNAFYTWLGAYEACLKAEHPEDAALTAMKIAEQLMNFCADLCYLNGTAPTDRTDSMLTFSYETLTAAEAAENCFRAVTDGRIVSYAEILCEEHRATDAEMINTLSAAKTAEEQEEVFKNNKQSWLNALSRRASERMGTAEAGTAELILNERNAFGKMLQAEESFMTGFYPDRPETVQEILMNTVRSHVIDCCK